MSATSVTGAGFLAPVVDPVAAAFWDGLAEGELRVQRCARCGITRFPPRPMCGACRSTATSWEAVDPTGAIWSFVVAHPPVLPAFADVAPFNVAVVALDADPSIRLVGNVVDAGGVLVPGDALEIGVPVELSIADVGAGVRLPRWRLRATECEP